MHKENKNNFKLTMKIYSNPLDKNNHLYLTKRAYQPPKFTLLKLQNNQDLKSRLQKS